ncbi:MAG: lipopolysaccharide transport periplasmic protein LptA [Aquificae bacterium]|nr:lipopolysaccharide transport periplasmic protein LptA [Aquificota bacterium]
MLKVFIALLIAFSITYAQTKENTEKKPIVIEADTLDYDKQKQIAVYKGNVVVKKDDFVMYSDVLKLYLDENGDIKKIVAVGNVRFKKDNRSGKSQEAVYYKDKNYIVLKGKAMVKQDNNIIEGDEIIYYLDTEKAEVVGKNKRVRTIFFPEDTKKEEKKD